MSEWLEARAREWWERLPEHEKERQRDQVDRACSHDCSYVECRYARQLRAQLAEWEPQPPG